MEKPTQLPLTTRSIHPKARKQARQLMSYEDVLPLMNFLASAYDTTHAQVCAMAGYSNSNPSLKWKDAGKVPVLAYRALKSLEYEVAQKKSSTLDTATVTKLIKLAAADGDVDLVVRLAEML